MQSYNWLLLWYALLNRSVEIEIAQSGEEYRPFITATKDPEQLTQCITSYIWRPYDLVYNQAIITWERKFTPHTIVLWEIFDKSLLCQVSSMLWPGWGYFYTFGLDVRVWYEPKLRVWKPTTPDDPEHQKPDSVMANQVQTQARMQTKFKLVKRGWFAGLIEIKRGESWHWDWPEAEWQD